MRLVLLYILIKKCRRVDENQWQQRLGRRLLVKAITVDQFAFSSRLDVGLTPKHLIHMSSSSYSRVVDLFPSRLLLARRPQSWNNNVAHSRTGKLYEDSSAFHKFSSLGPHPHTLPSAAPEVFGSAKNLEKASPDCKKTLSPLFGNRSEGIRAPLAGYVALPLDQQNEDFDVQRESGGRRFFFHLSTNDVVVWNSNTTDGGAQGWCFSIGRRRNGLDHGGIYQRGGKSLVYISIRVVRHQKKKKKRQRSFP